jgi:hypothetical protein
MKTNGCQLTYLFMPLKIISFELNIRCYLENQDPHAFVQQMILVLHLTVFQIYTFPTLLCLSYLLTE